MPVGRIAEHTSRAAESFQNIRAFPCLFCKFCPALVFVRTWSGLPSTGDFDVMLYLPISLQFPLNILQTPHGPRAMFVYVEIGADSSHLPPFQYLAPAALGLFGGVQYLYRRTSYRKDRVVLRAA